MNEQNQRDSIMSMARGAFEERVDYEMDKVIQNILDPNTKATAKRKITLTIELTPDDERRTIGVSVTAKSTLAATNPVATALYVTSDGNGELVVAEMVPQVPGQMNMDGTQQEAPKLLKLVQHRVLCGDCTRPEDRTLLLDGNKPEILLTDPPYCSGGSKESQKSTGSIGTERKNGKAPKIANDILSTRGYQNLIRGALTDIPCLYAYIFTDWRMWVYLFDLVEAAGFGVKSEIVWDKGTPGMGAGWRSQHELILFGAKAATHFDGHKGYGNVLSISRSGNELHPTQKPVELLEKLVDNTDFATGVYDPFGGSGTTLAACEAYGQPSYIMELTPAFTDVIVKRYIRITGKTTVRCVRQGRELPREEIAAIFEPDEEGGEQE